MSADINNYYDKAERALKRLSIFVVDEYEEMKRGNPLPIVGLMRKMLFSTSTTVMKQMLLRGCASHVSDKKFIIAVFDLLRDTVKHSPSITIDQFFTMGFANHKLSMVHKLAEYVANTDRSVVYSPNKVKFVIPNEIINQINDRISNGRKGSPTDDLLSSLLDDKSINNSTSKSIKSINKSNTTSDLDPNSNKFSKTAPVMDSPKKTYDDVHTNNSPSNRAIIEDLTRKLNNDLLSNFSPPSSPPLEGPTIVMRNNSLNNSGSRRSTPNRGRSKSPAFGRGTGTGTAAEEVVEGRGEAVKKNSTCNMAGDFTPTQMLQVSILIEDKVKQAVQEVTERQEFVMSKLVTAVDAEFTLLTQRIKELEDQLASNTNEKKGKPEKL